MSTLKIEVGKLYRTRDGHMARIYAIHSGQDFPVHGAVLGGNDRWICTAWTREGCDSMFYEKDFDIVSPWDDGPVVDWSKFPSHINVLAMDENGSWYGYTSAPTANDDAGEWRASEVYDAIVGLASEDEPFFDGDWTKSLVIRPGYEEKTA